MPTVAVASSRRLCCSRNQSSHGRCRRRFCLKFCPVGALKAVRLCPSSYQLHPYTRRGCRQWVRRLARAIRLGSGDPRSIARTPIYIAAGFPRCRLMRLFLVWLEAALSVATWHLGGQECLGKCCAPASCLSRGTTASPSGTCSRSCSRSWEGAAPSWSLQSPSRRRVRLSLTSTPQA